jgi:hypothetical protein
MTAMLSRVANLRVEPAGSIGGSPCFADSRPDPAALVIPTGRSMLFQNMTMLFQNMTPTLRPAGGRVTDASPRGVRA